ncbi:MAG: hypothetical protein ACRC2T_03560 [Thermoguttaceae bacterium]
MNNATLAIIGILKFCSQFSRRSETESQESKIMRFTLSNQLNLFAQVDNG